MHLVIGCSTWGYPPRSPRRHLRVHLLLLLLLLHVHVLLLHVSVLLLLLLLLHVILLLYLILPLHVHLLLCWVHLWLHLRPHLRLPLVPRRLGIPDIPSSCVHRPLLFCVCHTSKRHFSGLLLLPKCLLLHFFHCALVNVHHTARPIYAA